MSERQIDCAACDGLGVVEHPHISNYAGSHAESPADPVMVDCEECQGTGRVWIDGDEA